MAQATDGTFAQSDPARSRAVLVGVHKFAHLGPLPGVRSNLDALQEAFTDPGLWGLAPEHCTVLSQPESAEEVVNAVQRAAEQARDTLVVYYAGHGLTGRSQDELWLALPGSREQRAATVLHYDWLADEVRDSEARRKVVILDCCYSGRALSGKMGSVELVESALVHGAFLMTAASATRMADAPVGERYTAFTGELLEVLDRGVPGGARELDMMTLFRHVRRGLQSKGRTAPQQRNQELGAAITLFRNRAHEPDDLLPHDDAESPLVVPMSGGGGPVAAEPQTGGWDVPDPTEGWVWRDEAFRWGPFRTPLLIVEGDGEHVITEDSLRVIVDHREVRLPDELAEWRAEVEREQESLRERGENYFWNGKNYAIERVVISRHVATEAPIVTLRLRPSDYYNFQATQQHDRAFRDGTTPRTRYLDPHEPLDVPAFMSSSLGTNIAVVTADRKVIFSRRSNAVGSHPGLWNSSANEALSRDIDSAARTAPNLYNTARRGLNEELALESHEYDLDMLALTVDRKNQWGALFIARLETLTGEEFQARRSRGVADRFEHAGHALVPFRTRDMVRFMFGRERRELWAPGAPALFHLALVNEFTRMAVESESAEAFRELLREDA